MGGLKTQQIFKAYLSFNPSTKNSMSSGREPGQDKEITMIDIKIIERQTTDSNLLLNEDRVGRLAENGNEGQGRITVNRAPMCPDCGSKNVVNIYGRERSKLHCRICGNEWSEKLPAGAREVA